MASPLSIDWEIFFRCEEKITAALVCPSSLFIHIKFIYLHRNLKDALKRRQGAAVGDIETGTACFWGRVITSRKCWISNKPYSLRGLRSRFLGLSHRKFASLHRLYACVSDVDLSILSSVLSF